jgi:transcriptional regulator of acetoin/glycerol metabolism
MAYATAPRGAMLADPQHRESISESHQRCAALGVSRIDEPDLSRIARSDFRVALDRNRRLHEHAAPVMAVLHDQIARTESMVVLTDSQGTIIHAVGDDDFLVRASKVALCPGANWSERSKGTNAVGTALVDERPTLVHADEHYLHANNFLTCSAAPILDPRGNTLGVLDVSGDFRSYHQHTLALVRMSARMIENRWLTEDYVQALRLHFHLRPDYIGTIVEGIVAVAEDGRIVGANRGALELLGLSGAAVRMHTLATLFDISMATVVDHCRRQVAAPLTLRLANGQVMSGFARCAWPIGQVPGKMPEAEPAVVRSAAPAAAAPAQRPEVRALQALRTGDARIGAVIDKLERVLATDINLVLVGETGTGKEVLARAWHADSPRARLPFVAVSCMAGASGQLETELFGPAGRFALAAGSTLYIDEIGDMPSAVQASLLRALAAVESRPGPPGAPVAPRAIVCATRRCARELLDAGALREDLYYRLNGLTLQLPPLRERTDLLEVAARLLGATGERAPPALGAKARELLRAYRWPGNMRQLQQVLRAAALLASGGTVEAEHLPEELQPPAAPPESAGGTGAASPPGAAVGSMTIGDMELELIRSTLAAVGGNISETSKRLGISRNTIYRKLRWNAAATPH